MIKEIEFQKAFARYNRMQNMTFKLRAIFFDMDGVLFDSMPMHAEAWLKTFKEEGLRIDTDEPYLNEGSTALFTVRKMFRKYKNLEVGPEVAERIKLRKHQIMSELPEAQLMPQMVELLKNITELGIDCWVVTGSAQNILLDRLEIEFPGSLNRQNMITAYDVKIGKPHPEPYLQAIQKSGYTVQQAFVVENAPLGVASAKAAGLFTIAINTGPLDVDVLYEAGADIVYASSEELAENWETIFRTMKLHVNETISI
jgi:HAD superfamily hydrolase (TIGR01509 family)